MRQLPVSIRHEYPSEHGQIDKAIKAVFLSITDKFSDKSFLHWESAYRDGKMGPMIALALEIIGWLLSETINVR